MNIIEKIRKERNTFPNPRFGTIEKILLVVICVMVAGFWLIA